MSENLMARVKSVRFELPMPKSQADYDDVQLSDATTQFDLT